MIYLDNAATTKPDPVAVKAAEKFLSEAFFNPSALYGGGVAVHSELTRARNTVLGCIADKNRFDLIFTSCGTEADNQALFSRRHGNIVTTAGEHAAIYQTCMELKNRGTEVRFAPLLPDGRVDVSALMQLVDEKTSLVSVMHVNNETGAVNDILSIAKQVKWKNARCLFHSDGVQAFGKLPVRLTSDIDLYSVSAHKIGGLKGVGALIKKKGLTIPPLIYGGGQESALRSGTENTFGIMCFAAAAERRFSILQESAKQVGTLRETLWSRLESDRLLRISPKDGTPYILTVAVKNLRGEILQRLIEERGVLVGTGSACSSKHPYSRVIQACGVDRQFLNGVLRISFSPDTTAEETEKAAVAINDAVRDLTERTK